METDRKVVETRRRKADEACGETQDSHPSLDMTSQHRYGGAQQSFGGVKKPTVNQELGLFCCCLATKIIAT